MRPAAKLWVIAVLLPFFVLGGYAGPELMGTLKDWTGGYTVGLLAMAGVLFSSALLAASLRLLIKME